MSGSNRNVTVERLNRNAKASQEYAFDCSVREFGKALMSGISCDGTTLILKMAISNHLTIFFNISPSAIGAGYRETEHDEDQQKSKGEWRL